MGGRWRANRLASRALILILMACVALLVVRGEKLMGAPRTKLTVSLAITVSDGRGNTQHASLTCRNGRAATAGFLGGDPVKLCRSARRLAPLLTSQPDRDRICTQIYGGPESAHIHGTIGERRVDRRFSRTDGCEIADWDQAKGLFAGVT